MLLIPLSASNKFDLPELFCRGRPCPLSSILTGENQLSSVLGYTFGTGAVFAGKQMDAETGATSHSDECDAASFCGTGDKSLGTGEQKPSEMKEGSQNHLTGCTHVHPEAK